MQKTEVARRERLLQSPKEIYRDVQQLLINDHIFGNCRRIVRKNNNSEMHRIFSEMDG
jgi:hypothetical protein